MRCPTWFGRGHVVFSEFALLVRNGLCMGWGHSLFGKVRREEIQGAFVVFSDFLRGDEGEVSGVNEMGS